MTKTLVFKSTKWWIYPSLAIAIIIAALIGSALGRVVTVACVPKDEEGTKPAYCNIRSEGYLFTWLDDRIEVAAIKDIYLNVITTRSKPDTTRIRNQPRSRTNTQSTLIIDTTEAGLESRHTYSDYSFMDSPDHLTNMHERLLAFKENPKEGFTASYGEHYSGILTSLGIAGVLIVTALGLGHRRLVFSRTAGSQGMRMTEQGYGPMSLMNKLEQITNLREVINLQFDAGNGQFVLQMNNGEVCKSPPFPMNERTALDAKQKLQAFIA
jgi:hypothetical protein